MSLEKNRAPYANMIITKYALFTISSFWVKIWDELKMKKNNNNNPLPLILILFFSKAKLKFVNCQPTCCDD